MFRILGKLEKYFNTYLYYSIILFYINNNYCEKNCRSFDNIRPCLITSHISKTEIVSGSGTFHAILDKIYNPT